MCVNVVLSKLDEYIQRETKEKKKRAKDITPL